MSLSFETTPAVEQLRERLHGQLLLPGDGGYDEARTVFHGGIDRRPAAIARVADASDVVQAVGFAREAGLELAIRGGGHSGAGHGVTEGGLMIDLAGLRALEIDRGARTAWAETGLTAGEFTRAAGARGVATGFGDSGSVGIGGITLGGGVGFLSRKHGLTIDNLLGAEVVTADGRLLHADAETHPDLFWALRGGGGNFGVATRLRFRLHELDAVVGGMLILPATAEVIAGFVALADQAPDELTTIANVMPAPPMPFVPTELHGSLIVMALMTYAGPERAAERVLAPFRALAEPIASTLRPMPYAELFPPDAPDYHPRASARTMFLDGVEGPAAETILRHLRSGTAPMRVVQLRVLGGAIARVADDATAYAHRPRRVMANVAAVSVDPGDVPEHAAWVERFADALHDGTPGAYVNFLGDEGQARVREAYRGATWHRLRDIKARYDPDNVFRLNQNIPPA